MRPHVVGGASKALRRKLEEWVPFSYPEDYARLAGDTVALRFGEYHRITEVAPGGGIDGGW